MQDTHTEDGLADEQERFQEADQMRAQQELEQLRAQLVRAGEMGNLLLQQNVSLQKENRHYKKKTEDCQALLSQLSEMREILMEEKEMKEIVMAHAEEAKRENEVMKLYIADLEERENEARHLALSLRSAESELEREREKAEAARERERELEREILLLMKERECGTSVVMERTDTNRERENARALEAKYSAVHSKLLKAEEECEKLRTAKRERDQLMKSLTSLVSANKTLQMEQAWEGEEGSRGRERSRIYSFCIDMDCPI